MESNDITSIFAVSFQGKLSKALSVEVSLLASNNESSVSLRRNETKGLEEATHSIPWMASVGLLCTVSIEFEFGQMKRLAQAVPSDRNRM